jgi:hypothetical protein
MIQVNPKLGLKAIDGQQDTGKIEKRGDSRIEPSGCAGGADEARGPRFRRRTGASSAMGGGGRMSVGWAVSAATRQKVRRAGLSEGRNPRALFIDDVSQRPAIDLAAGRIG